MTRLEALEKIKAHFSQPGAVYGWGNYTSPATDYDPEPEVETACVYRGGGNPTSHIRCAMGVLIPDELYQPSMEGSVADATLRSHSGLAEAMGLSVDKDGEWLNVIQRIHDDCARSGDLMTTFLDKIENEITQERAREDDDGA